MKSEQIENLEYKVSETLHITCSYLGTLTLEELVQGQYPEEWEQIQNHYFSSEGSDYYFVLSETHDEKIISRTRNVPSKLDRLEDVG